MASPLHVKEILDHFLGLDRAEGKTAGSRPGADAASADLSESGPTSPAKSTHHEVIEGLKRVIGTDGQALVGQVQLIGLSKFRGVFGAEWPAIRDKARAIASAAIERRLVKGDVFTLYGDEDYLILFASLPEREAQIKCAMIAEEVSKRLIGESADPSVVEVKSAVRVVGKDIKFEKIDVDRIFKSLLAQRVSMPDDKTVPRKNSAELSTKEKEKENVAHTLTTLNIIYVYRPIWFIKQNVVSSYTCVPARVTDEGRFAYGSKVLPGGERSGLVGTLDCMTLRRILGDLEKLMQGGTIPPVLGMAIHFETLAISSVRNLFFEICRAIPEPNRRRIVFELLGVPSDIAHPRLYEIVSLVKPFCRAVLLRLQINSHNLIPLDNVPLHAVGLELSDELRPEADLMREMQSFAVRAEKHGFKKYVHGLRSVSLITAAVYAGFDYVDGDPLTSIVDTHADIRRFHPLDLFLTRRHEPLT
jgi:hypothetical protein